MKTKEEIEQLANEWTNGIDESYKVLLKEVYIKVYTQCQEDNKDKKYTEEDIKEAFMEGCQSERRLSRRIDELDKYINSLKKQD